MFKKIIKRFSGHHEKVRNHRLLKRFERFLHLSRNYFHMNHRSVSRAIGIGFFCVFMPFPFQTLMVIILALLVRANIPIAYAVIWINNPLTVAPIYYGALKLGEFILSSPPVPAPSFSLAVLWQELSVSWKPFFLGISLCGVVSGILAYYLTYWIWCFCVLKKRKSRLKNKE